ncbi:Fc.00g023630.m01.CDS01 [Cosmosporella sp. VM-42]
MAPHILQSLNPNLESTSLDLPVTDFNNPWRALIIHRLIRRENHSEVYSVRDFSSMEENFDIEARAFMLDEVPVKVRRHRLRCINRLKNRTVLTGGARGATVVAYKKYNLEWDDIKGDPAQFREDYWSRQPLHWLAEEQYQNKAREVGDLVGSAEELFRAVIFLYLAYDKQGRLRSSIPVEALKLSTGSSKLAAIVSQDWDEKILKSDDYDVLKAYTYLSLKEKEVRFFGWLEEATSRMSCLQVFTGIKETLRRISENLEVDTSAAFCEMYEIFINEDAGQLRVLQHVQEVLSTTKYRAEVASQHLSDLLSPKTRR